MKPDKEHRWERPWPPAGLTDLSALTGQFVPSPDALQWLRRAYLDERGPFHTPEHAHLASARIGVLWTNAENTRQMRRIVGQAEIPARTGGRLGKWPQARQEQQLLEWFGQVPDFLITLDALHAASVDDVSFCALVDHELYHCAQATDRFGMPRFNQATGEPVWAIKGHDVEEFVGVVRRFGVEAAGEAATDMVIAAAQSPEIAPAAIAGACGTCVLKAAA